MATRIDLELTSDRADGTWTWRAAGAKLPKGVVEASVLPDGAVVGEVYTAEADYLVEGIEITKVLPKKDAKTSRVETLEILGSGRTEELVTTKLYKGGKGRDGGGGRGRGRGDGGRGRGDGDRGRGDGGRGTGDGGRGRGGDGGSGRSEGGRGRGDGSRGRPQQAPRLKPANVHRAAWLDSMTDVQRPIAEQLIDGGMPSIRTAIERQAATSKAEGKPDASNALLALAESLAGPLKTAEWRDRAEAAIAGVDTVDIRDLRSVVASAESGARDEESRDMAETLRTKINQRLDKEHQAWLAGIETAIKEERIVRALRSSARPVKPGTPMSAELATKLVEATNAALSEDEEPGRWATVIDALAFSPIREFVTPAGIPDAEDREIVSTVKKLANRVPQIAKLFGIEPKEETRRRTKPKGKSSDKPGKDAEGSKDTKSSRKPKGTTAPIPPPPAPKKADPSPATPPAAGEAASPAAPAPEPKVEVAAEPEATTPTVEVAAEPEADTPTVEVAAKPEVSEEPTSAPAPAEPAVGATDKEETSASPEVE